MSEVSYEELRARVRETPLVERLERCRELVGEMSRQGRPPRMSIPVSHTDEDVFITTTIEDAISALAMAREEHEACGCFSPGEGNAAECGLRADERDPYSVRRVETGDYADEDCCPCDCHRVPAEWELEEELQAEKGGLR